MEGAFQQSPAASWALQGQLGPVLSGVHLSADPSLREIIRNQCPLVICYITIENAPFSLLMYLFKMVIFHGFWYVYHFGSCHGRGRTKFSPPPGTEPLLRLQKVAGFRCLI